MGGVGGLPFWCKQGGKVSVPLAFVTTPINLWPEPIYSHFPGAADEAQAQQDEVEIFFTPGRRDYPMTSLTATRIGRGVKTTKSALTTFFEDRHKHLSKKAMGGSRRLRISPHRECL